MRIKVSKDTTIQALGASSTSTIDFMNIDTEEHVSDYPCE